MKKTMPLTQRRAYVPKEPGYTSREQVALDNADRVVTRIRIQGEWKEREWMPAEGQSVRQCLEGIQSQLRHSPDIRGVCLYVSGAHPTTGERMKAAMPSDWVPASLRR